VAGAYSQWMRTDVAAGLRTARIYARALALAAAACTALAAPAALADDPTGAAAPSMRLYRDPQTGAIGAPTGAAALDDQPAAAASARQRVATELSEEAVEVPGGGVKINLRGNFRAAVRRVVQDGGPGGHTCTELGAGTSGPTSHE
jgi:hypothetical protein